MPGKDKHDKSQSTKSSAASREQKRGRSPEKPGGQYSRADQAGRTLSGTVEAVRDMMRSDTVNSALQKGGEMVTTAGERLTDTGRKALDTSKSLLSGLMDMSVLLGLAAGVGVWWLMHDTGDQNAGDIEIKSGDAGVSGLVGRVQGGASHMLESVGESASAVSNTAVQKAQSAMHEVQGAVEKNPWVFVAGGLLVGSLLAILIPQTTSENRLMGGMRDQVVDQAQTTVKDTLHSTVAKSAVEAVKNKLG